MRSENCKLVQHTYVCVLLNISFFSHEMRKFFLNILPISSKGHLPLCAIFFISLFIFVRFFNYDENNADAVMMIIYKK